MLPLLDRRRTSGAVWLAGCASFLLAACALAQDNAGAAASVPASAAAPKAPSTAPRAMSARPSARQAREAEDAYLEGAAHVQHRDLAAAERSFAQAVKLNPANSDYVLALALTRQQRVTALVQNAAKARLLGDAARADALLAEAETLDPGNSIVQQHLDAPALPAQDSPRAVRASEINSSLAGPVHLRPASGTLSFHQRGPSQDLLRAVYAAFGIKVTFDASVTANPSIRLDLDDVNFADATRVITEMTHTFAVALQPDAALIAKNTQEDRERLIPQIEETIYLPGVASDQLSELANVARNVFDVKQVTATAGSGDLLLRGDEDTLRLLNATYDDMLDGGSEVLLDIHLYELDKTHLVNIGAQLPSSAGVFSIAAEAQQLVNANQGILQQAIANGLKLNGTPLQNLITEVEFLIGSGVVTSSQYTNLLGIFGGGLTFAGLYLGSSSSFNLLLNSSEVRTLDAVTLRGNSGQDATFRAGTRYPVVTATYSSGVSSALSSQLSGLSVNGTSVSSLLSQYLGSSSVTVPQFQYEDLGITLKATPRILHTGDVSLKLDMKIEALGGGTINTIPILNSRQLTSTINIPAGQTAMLASLISANESKSIQGLPGLSELPGFQGTDQNTEKDSQELLITITPHIVRSGSLHIASRRLAFPRSAAGSGSAQ